MLLAGRLAPRIAAIRRWKTHRIAAVLAACIIHAVLLAALAVGIPWTQNPGPAEPVIHVTLERPLPQAPAPPKERRAPTKAPPRQTPPPSALAAPHIAPAPTGPAPEIDAGEKAAAGDVMRALRATVGCANPDAVGLSPAERAACHKALRASLGEVKPMSGLTAEKRARFDREVQCHEAFSAPVPPAHAASNGVIPGMGDMPRMRDCPAWDR